MINKKLILVGIALITLGIIATTQATLAISPYDSGFNHGCDDAQLPPNDRYINEPGKGPKYHTDAFMDGYRDGFKECFYDQNDQEYYPGSYETNTAVDDSFNNRDSVVQPQSQSANTVQSAGCPSQIINGDCIIGQEQAVNNEFAQANRADN